MDGPMASAAHTIDDHAHSRITPELVLVDPELSRRVRPRVPLHFLRRTPPLPALHFAADKDDVTPVAARAAAVR
jgi:hypothetical protein